MSKSTTVDAGVRGLENSGAVIQDYEQITKKPVQEEEYGKYIQQQREAANDKTRMLKAVFREVVKLVFIGKIASKVLELMVGEKWAGRIVRVAAFVYGVQQVKAPVKVNKHLNSSVPCYPIIGSLPALLQNQKAIHDFFLDIIRKNNFESQEITIPGVHFLSLMDPRDREHALRNHFANYTKNLHNEFNSFELAFAELFGRGIFAVDGPEWKDHRKIASQLFSGNGLKSKMESVFNRQADFFKQVLLEKAKTNEAFDMQAYFQAMIFDVFCEIGFGLSPKSFDAALRGEKEPFLVSFDVVQANSMERFFQPPFLWSILRIFDLAGERDIRHHHEKMREYIMPIVKERKKTMDVSSGDMLSLYISYARDLGLEYILEDEYLLDVVGNFMVAGRDTTACSLTNFFKYLATNKQAEQILLKEIAAKFPGGDITLDTSRTMNFASSCVNEALRLLPPVCNDFRYCVEDEVLPSGIQVKRGMQLMFNNIAIGRDPSLWTDPNSFKPERWMSLADKPGGVRRPDEFILPVFHGGPRLCLGHAMARFEMITFMAKVCPDVEVIPLPNQSDDTMTGPIGWYRDGFVVKTRKRM